MDLFLFFMFVFEFWHFEHTTARTTTNRNSNENSVHRFLLVLQKAADFLWRQFFYQNISTMPISIGTNRGFEVEKRVRPTRRVKGVSGVML